MTSTSAPSAPPRSPVEAARAAGIRWQAAVAAYDAHDARCTDSRIYCPSCSYLEAESMFAAVEYGRVLEEARRAGTGGRG